MLVHPYTIYQQPSSCGTALAGHTSVFSPQKQVGCRFLRPGSRGIPVLRVTEQDAFTRGEPMPRSMGHLVPYAKTTPPSQGFIPQRHSTPGSLPIACTRHRYLSWGNAQVASPSKTCPKTRRMSCLIDSTLTTYPRRTPRSPRGHYQVITMLSAPCALSTH
jgi:hypothetical protein